MGQREKWQDFLSLPNLLLPFRLHSFPIGQIKLPLTPHPHRDLGQLMSAYLLGFSKVFFGWSEMNQVSPRVLLPFCFALFCCFFSVFLMGLKRATEDAKLTGMGRDSARSHLSRGKKGSWVSCSLKRLGSLRAGWGGVVHLTKSLHGLLAICFYCSPVWAVPKQSSAASSSLWNQTLDSPQQHDEIST